MSRKNEWGTGPSGTAEVLARGLTQQGVALPASPPRSKSQRHCWITRVGADRIVADHGLLYEEAGLAVCLAGRSLSTYWPARWHIDSHGAVSDLRRRWGQSQNLERLRARATGAQQHESRDGGRERDRVGDPGGASAVGWHLAECEGSRGWRPVGPGHSRRFVHGS